MTLARRHDWSGTPLKAGLGPAAAHLRASPPAAGPSGHQLTGDWQDWQDWQDLQDWQDWQSAVKGDFGCPNLQFGRPGGSILVPWDTILVIWCPPGPPNRGEYLSSGGQGWILIDLGSPLGSNWGSFW